jgi:hypothetical protein
LFGSFRLQQEGADTAPLRRPQQPLKANTKARNSIPQQKRFMALTPILWASMSPSQPAL